MGSTQIAAEWQIRQDSTLIYDTGTDTTDLTSLIVPSGKLTAGSSYSWQVRYEDNYNDWSSYSTVTSFATTPVPEPAGMSIVFGALLLSTRRRRGIARG